MNEKFVLGIDYGTQSGRVVIVSVENGKEVGSSVTMYKSGVIDNVLMCTGEKLAIDWALQDPDDYLDVLFTGVPKAIEKSCIDAKDIIGIGVDFTSCTMMPIDKDGQVLCQKDKYRKNPHSWVKLWKHHAAQQYANKINEIAKERGESFLSRYGGKISAEWLIAKIWQIAEEAPEIYENTYRFIEATDWITMQMTGKLIKNSCTAGYKAIWSKEDGYPSKDFFKALNPKLENLVEDKLEAKILPIGKKAGVLQKEIAEKMGLNEGISVSVGNVDAHVSAAAVNVVNPGQMIMIMGTSTCDILISEEERLVPGICGVADDGAIPGYYAYESGQNAVGDIFEWFVDNCVPESYKKEANEKNINIHCLLEEKASKLKPGESGLLALDWWNGNRSILVDTDLTGLILGMDLLTKPEEIYRALIEATAFAKRVIIENYREHGVPVKEIFACGGLSYKNNMLMQIYADITDMEIRISESTQTPALGAAMYGAVAAGGKVGGYDDIFEAAKHMSRVKEYTFKPIEDNVKIYNEMYKEYIKLHDYFGYGINNVMRNLKKLKKRV